MSEGSCLFIAVILLHVPHHPTVVPEFFHMGLLANDPRTAKTSRIHDAFLYISQYWFVIL